MITNASLLLQSSYTDTVDKLKRIPCKSKFNCHTVNLISVVDVVDRDITMPTSLIEAADIAASISPLTAVCLLCRSPIAHMLTLLCI